MTDPFAVPPPEAQRPPPSADMLVISSQVVRGSVGGRAGFVLERLGHRVWQVPTVLLPWHPGHGRGTRIVASDADFAALCADLAGSPRLREIGGIVSGYLGNAAQAGPIAALVAAVKAANPAALYLCDPVIGDAGGLYVPEATAAAIRDRLLPLADIATPNMTELAWLTAAPVAGPGEAVAAARTLGPARVAVTSAPAMMRGKIATLLVSATDAVAAENQLVAGAPSGTGDLFAALLLQRLVIGMPDEKALAHAVAATFEVLVRSARAGADELALTIEQSALVRPMAMVDIRRVAAPRRPAPQP
ncbi:pyridoxal kinase [Methylobrevis albus]|nr:pyridoxal kinase [Methylobrevis albus]